MTLLKDNNYKEINVALLSLEADIKNKITNFDTSVIDRQLAEINSRIDKINAGGNNTSAEINDIRYEIEDINSKLNGNSAKIENIEQKLTDIFSAENKVTDFNTTTDSGIYYWLEDAANKPVTNYGVLLVNKYDSGDSNLWINQIAYGTNGKIYFRQNINSGKWTDWKAVAFEGEIKALTVNGKTYDGSEAVDAGVQKIENGGTGVTTQADINKAFISGLYVGSDDVTDGTEFVSSYASDKGFADTSGLNKPYKRQFIKVWNYIKGKISSVLGLTSEKVSSYDSHLSNKDNPHSVTKSQVGLGSVVNTGDSATPVSGGTTKFTTGGAYTELNKVATAISTAETNAKNLANATGTLAVANGGTGQTTANAAANSFINSLTTGESVPKDDDYFISQYVDGGTTNTTYHRRPVSKLWEYIKGKISSVLGLTATNYGGKAATATTASSANKIAPKYTTGYLQTVSSATTKYIKLADCVWYQTGTLQVHLTGNAFEDTLVINFSGSNSLHPMLCGYCSSHAYLVKSVIAQKATAYNSNYSIYVKIQQVTTCTVDVALLKGNCTINITESTTAPTNISEWPISDGFFGNLTGNVKGKSSFLDEYPGAGGTRPTSGNIKPKDASEYGGMRKDVVTASMTDSGRPNCDGHLLTMFWDNTGRFDSQFFVSNGENRPEAKLRFKTNKTDYGPWIDVITSNNIGSQTVANATNARTAADAGFLCKLYTLDSATSDSIIQANNVILLGKIPDPASTAAPATPSSSWDIDVDFYFVRSQGHKAAWCNVKAGYGYSNAWRKYGLIETFGVDASSNYTNPFYLVTLKYNNEYYIGVRHLVNIDGSYAARVKNVNTAGSRNPSTVNNTPLVNMLKVIPFQKTLDGTILNSEVKSSIADFPNTYAPTVERNGRLILKSDYVQIGTSGVAGSKLTIQGATVNSNSYTDTNPKLEFKNNDGSQNISLTFTDYDAVQAPASLTLNGNQGNEYFIAPNIKATTKFTGNLTGNVTGNVSGSSGSAGKLTTARTAYVDLGTASTTTTIDWSGDTTIPVNGVLQVEHGGTGANTAQGAADSLIASLPASDGVPVDTDYFISQMVNGGPFVPAYQRRPISKLWEYIKGKILQEGEEFGYDHIVHDGASLLEWANCTDGSMKKVLIKSGTYNITKGVDLSAAGTGYVLAENGAVINSHVPIAFTAPSGKTVVHNLNVICDGAANGDNTCAFSADNPENLILYDCSATYRTYTEIVNRELFSKCTCYNCSYAFQNLPANSSISIKAFYQCRCYNCKCLQTIEANSNVAISFYTESYFYKECHCSSCDAELTTSRNIKAATTTFACYYNCWDRCVGCLSKINVNSKALTVYSTLYGFLRCQHMSSCKEVHTEGYSNIKGIVQCDFISSTSAVSGESNTSVGNSCDI